jgi:hypothetical protein
MRRAILITTMVLAMALIAVSFSFAATPKGKLDVKVGDQFYVCNCGEGCACNTISRKPGKCTCAHDEMVKATVTRVEGDVAYFKAEGWDKERPFKTVGKYMCACGPECGCDTISQKPGKCACGKKMKKVK